MWRIALVLAGCGRVFGLVELHDDAPAGDLVARYKLDNDFLDATGHGHDASCVDEHCPAPLVAGHRDGAFAFDGIDDYLVVAGSDDFATNAGTVTAWLSMTTLPPLGASCPLNKLLGTQGDNTWQLCIEATQRIDFFTSLDAIFAPGAFPLGGWHHVAIRWNGAAKVISLDGIDIASGGTAPLTFQGDALLIGSDNDAGGVAAPFAGFIDEVRIYDRELSADEITQLFQQ